MADFKFYLNRQGVRGRQGEKGDAGFSPTVSVGKNTAQEYTLLIQNQFDSFETDNLRGSAVDNRGGTYMRFDQETGEMFAGEADMATPTQAGVVQLTPPSGELEYDETTAVSPATLLDVLEGYAKSSELPVVGNGMITINQNGVQKGTFTVNQEGNTVINLDGGGSETVDVNWGDIKGLLSNQSDLAQALSNKANQSDLANLATKDEVQDVKNSIPTVGDGKVTIRQGGEEKGSFTLNQSGDVTVELTAGGGGSAPDNMVTTDTEQTISGFKTFGRIKVGGTATSQGAWLAATNETGTSKGLYISTQNVVDNECAYGIGNMASASSTSVSGFKVLDPSRNNDGTNYFGFGIFERGNSNLTQSFFGWKKDEKATVIIPQLEKSNNKLYVTTDDVKFGSTLATATSLLGGGGSAPENMVTTDTDQKITATKTFSKSIRIYDNTGANGTGRVDISTTSLGSSAGSLQNSLQIVGGRQIDIGSRRVSSTGVEGMIRGASALTIESTDTALTLACKADAPRFRRKTSADDYTGSSTTYMLHQGNVTAGDNISIENTSFGIKISSTGGGSLPSSVSSWTLKNSNDVNLSFTNDAGTAMITKPNGQNVIDIKPANSNSLALLRISEDDVQFSTSSGTSTKLSELVNTTKTQEIDGYKTFKKGLAIGGDGNRYMNIYPMSDFFTGGHTGLLLSPTTPTYTTGNFTTVGSWSNSVDNTGLAGLGIVNDKSQSYSTRLSGLMFSDSLQSLKQGNGTFIGKDNNETDSPLTLCNNFYEDSNTARVKITGNDVLISNQNNTNVSLFNKVDKNSDVIDGQFIATPSTYVTTGTELEKTDKTFDLSGSIPANGKKCFIFISGRVTAGTSGTRYVEMATSEANNLFYGGTSSGQCNMVVPLGTDRRLTIRGGEDPSANYRIVLNGYRYIGSNTQ